MNRRTFVKLSSAGALSLPATAREQGAARRVTSLDPEWRFSLGEFHGAEQPEFDDAGWRFVDIPHDWGIEGPFSPSNPSGRSGGYAATGVGWYRKRFRLDTAAKGRHVRVEFDGVYENATIWFNGAEIGIHRYGYSSFAFDLTPHARHGRDNVLAVRVDNSRQPNCRWYSGSGIYRHVRLVETDPLRIAHWGVWVTTPEVSSAEATVRVQTNVVNDRDAKLRCRLLTVVRSPGGGRAGRTEDTVELAAGATHAFDQEIRVAEPELWSPETPVLYSLETKLTGDDTLADDYETPFGIRTAVFDKDRGFLLNGKPVKMRGVCLHHDCGCLGAAVPVRAWERRLDTLKSIGCNAIRTSHNPPAPEFLDLCDRLGFLVIDEAFDKWDGGAKRWMPIDWPELWRQDLRSVLERDRNHPSVMLWSVGNETGQPGDEKMMARLTELVEFVHGEEPSRPATTALIAVLSRVSNQEKARRLVATSKLVDVLCLNYQEQWYETIRRANPTQVMISTEAFPYYRGGKEQLMQFHERNPWYDVVRHPYVAGQFLWPGIDYLGESLDWPSKGWPTGLLDTCGFLKPFSGFHRAVWNPAPAVKLAVQHDCIDRDNGREHWHWPKLAAHWNFAHLRHATLRLHVFTNCETVELLLNGKSLGARRTAEFPNNTIEWHTEYKAGTIEAIARNGGHEAARDRLVTAGKPARLELLPDRTTLEANGEDLSHIEVRLLDEHGVLVPDADRRVTFRVRGAGRLAGVDNGDLRSSESFQAPYRTTFQGRCLAIVRSYHGAGAILVTARAPGLPEAVVEIQTS